MTALKTALARAFVKLRLVIVVVWIGGAVWAAVALPPIHGGTSGTLRSLLPSGSPALTAERISSHDFAFPVLSRTIVVVSNPHGLPLARQTFLVELAKRLSFGQVPGFRKIAGALPLTGSVGGPRFAPHPGTTALMYLLYRQSVSSFVRTDTARRLVHQVIGHRAGEFEGVTGEIPAQVAAERLIIGRLKWVELATVLLVALAIAVHFRAVGAAVLTLGAVISAYVVADRVVAQIAAASGITVPSQVRPVLVVLVFGVATDYSIFFLSRFRALLAEGLDRRAAAVTVVREITPIVVTAGITVAAGTAALLAAHLGFVRGFGPALAIAVLVAMTVAVSLVPAVLAVAGERVFWPSRIAPSELLNLGPRPVDEPPRRFRLSTARLAARHPVAAAVVAVIIVAGAASGLSRTAVANEMVLALPASAGVHQAYTVAERAYAPGVLAPMVVVETGPGVGYRRTALARLQATLAGQPDIAQAFGPAQRPPGSFGHVAVWTTPDAARYVLFFASEPLGSHAIAEARRLKRRLPVLVRQAGLSPARAMLGGDTAISADIVAATTSDLGRVTPVMLGAIFVVIAIFLRALVAPIYLVLTSVLAAAAALGLTTYVMQELLGYGQTTYYAVFTVAVLLISLGSDYNVFLVGRVWQEGRRRRLRDAVAVAGTRAARPIRTAAFVLALSFALVVIVPVRAFREIGFAMAIGLMIDAFVVRAVLVPALLVLVGPHSAWPGKLLAHGDETAAGSGGFRPSRTARGA